MLSYLGWYLRDRCTYQTHKSAQAVEKVSLGGLLGGSWGQVRVYIVTTLDEAQEGEIRDI